MYYIAVLPPESIRDEVKGFKEEIRERFHSSHALRSPAHITLQMPFHFEESRVAELTDKIARLAQKLTPVTCELEHFGHFGNRVVYVNVKPSPTLNLYRQQLQQLLREEFHFSEKKLPDRFTPHITIANRDLTPENFTPCMETFNDRDYARTFEIDALVILKHCGDHWEVYREFPFNKE